MKLDELGEGEGEDCAGDGLVIYIPGSVSEPASCHHRPWRTKDWPLGGCECDVR